MFKKTSIKAIKESLSLLIIAAIIGTIVSIVAQLFIISAKNIYEFNNSYAMIEDKEPYTVLGYSGTNKEDFINIICNSREFYEGIIRWTYLTLLARVPTTIETDFLMNDFYISCDFHKLQRYVMQTDEYAHF